MAFDADVIVLGAGAAGTFAASGLDGTNVLVLDYGNQPEEPSPEVKDFDELKQRSDAFHWMIGEKFESLDPLFRQEVTPKVRSPLMKYVVRDADELNQNNEGDFGLLSSLAQGGLANVWGAQVYRFDDVDLGEFPLTRAELDPYYDSVSREIGISGSASDDLAKFHGSEPELQPPLEASRLGHALYQGYLKNRPAFARRGVSLGKPRLAILTREHRGRSPLRYDNLEFFLPENPAYYSPVYTLRTLIARGSVRYLGGMRALRFRETADGVEVDVCEKQTGEVRVFRARKLVIALGCVQSARFVLESANDHTTELPILENPMTMTPVVHPGFIGSAHEKRGYSSELTLYLRDDENEAFKIGMIYNLGGLLSNDFLFSFPFPVGAGIAAARVLLPAMLALQIYYPMGATAGNRLRLKPDGGLAFSFRHQYDGALERRVLACLRRTGFLSHPILCKRGKPGASVHYAGSLPMQTGPRRAYQTDPAGRLEGHRHVHVADSSTFPFLPAKNLTFTIMANALRIGQGLRDALKAERIPGA